MSNSYDLKGKSVLITGGNGQLGSTLIKRFLAQGAFVHVTDIHPSISENLAKSLKKGEYGDFKYHILDVTDEASVQKVFNAVKQLDILVNNAGIGMFTPFEERKPEEIDAVMDVNIKGTILCTKAFAAKAKKGACIINIGSMYGVVAADKRIYGNSGRNSSEIYAATKAGVIHMTKYFAVYLADKGITVNAVSPGGIFNEQEKGFVDRYVDKTPLKRMATTDDIASAVLFFASDEASYSTGQNMIIDGGFTLNQ